MNRNNRITALWYNKCLEMHTKLKLFFGFMHAMLVPEISVFIMQALQR